MLVGAFGGAFELVGVADVQHHGTDQAFVDVAFGQQGVGETVLARNVHQVVVVLHDRVLLEPVAGRAQGHQPLRDLFALAKDARLCFEWVAFGGFVLFELGGQQEFAQGEAVGARVGDAVALALVRHDAGALVAGGFAHERLFVGACDGFEVGAHGVESAHLVDVKGADGGALHELLDKGEIPGGHVGVVGVGVGAVEKVCLGHEGRVFDVKSAAHGVNVRVVGDPRAFGGTPDLKPMFGFVGDAVVHRVGKHAVEIHARCAPSVFFIHHISKLKRHVSWATGDGDGLQRLVQRVGVERGCHVHARLAQRPRDDLGAEPTVVREPRGAQRLEVVPHVVEPVAHPRVAKVKGGVHLGGAAGHLAKLPVGAAKPLLFQEHRPAVMDAARVSADVGARRVVREEDLRVDHGMLGGHQPRRGAVQDVTLQQLAVGR